MVSSTCSRAHRDRLSRWRAHCRVSATMSPRMAAWEPTKPVEFIVPAGTGGGADQMARFIQGRRRQEQPDEAAARSSSTSRAARAREGFLDVKEREGRSAQDHHHAVEPVHDAARDRRAVQLEGPDAGGDARARRVRAVGQRRDAVQDRAASTSTPIKAGSQQPVQDGGHRLEAGRPDHHGRAREGESARR